MSAPDYDDPDSRLKIKLRPMRGSASISALASGIGLLGMCLCVVGFLISFWPGVAVSGDRWWFLFGAIVFSVAAALFNWVGKLLGRLK